MNPNDIDAGAPSGDAPPAPDAPPTSRDATVDRVVAAYEELMHRLVSAHLPEFMEVAVTMSQAKVLYTVLAAGSLRMSELASRLGVSLSTTSGQVDRLVDLGLLDRRDDPADRRQVVVSVTPSGETQVGRFRELNNEQLLLMLDRVGDADLALVEQAMAVLVRAATPPGADGPALSKTLPTTTTDRKDDSR
jgi:DNA-binding MarR family transcriptional regulator